MLNSAGEVVQWFGTNTDASDRKRAEEEIARLAAQSDQQRWMFETALSNNADFIYLFDLRGRFLYVNRALLALWRKDLLEVVGKNFFELDYPTQLAERLQRQIQQVIDTKQPVKDETPYAGFLGERDYEYIFVPVLGGGGAVEAVAGSTRDITERKRQAEALQEADRRKDEFLATLAHELRNPLASIRNGLQLMRLTGAGGEALEPTRAMMDRQLTQLVRLVDDLMDVSRITRGKIELRKERIQLATVIDSAVETSRPLIQKMDHELTVALPAQPVEMDADLIRLAQVFSNLLNNSAKYSDRGGHIWLTAERAASEVVISVKDAGLGIAADQLPRIFELFTQVDRSLDKAQGGLGIGLSLVKGLVEMHGGSIEARSEGLGHGSEFAVRLPIVVEATAPRTSGNDTGTAAPPTLLRVLVVDDNQDGADSLTLILRLMGNDVCTAYDGRAAVNLATEFRPDVVLLDIGLPSLNGYEACQRIREQPWGKDIVIVAATGWGQEEDRRRSQEAGFDHHMVKPVDPQALMKLLAGLQAARR